LFVVGTTIFSNKAKNYVDITSFNTWGTLSWSTLLPGAQQHCHSYTMSWATPPFPNASTWQDTLHLFR
jgi:hypothetical protein